jgi:hypothetical protein
VIRSIDVLGVVESWHDVDSVVLRRLRVEGYSVVDRSRPRSFTCSLDLSTNHGGVLLCAIPGVQQLRLLSSIVR